MAPPPPPPPPPPPMPGFLRTFSRPREGGLKRSASTSSQATLTSKSNVDKLEFSTDSDSYKVAQISRSNSVTPGLSRGPSRGASSQGPSRAPTPAGAVAIPGPSVWGWGRRWDSMSTLVSEEPAKDLGPEEPPKEKVSTTARLAALRKKMAEEKLDYYIVPSEDAHQSEYVAPADRRREYITGFSGSAGVAIVSQNGAYLFVDSRYWVQAAQEIDNNWILQKVGFEGTRDWQQFLLDRPRNSRIGLDSRMISHEVATTLTASLATRQSRITFPRQNLVDLIWKDRPQRPKSPVMIHTVEFTGKEAKDKIYEIRRFIKSHITPPAPPPVAKAGGHNPPKPPPEAPKPVATLISSLSTIAYTLNLRGSDVPYNPVFLAYLFIGLDRAVLFVELAKISPDVKNYLKDLGISVREYADVWTYLRKREWGEGKILIPAQTPYAVSLLLTSYKYQIVPPFVDNMKAIKNEVEIAGFRKAYMRDGAAMVRWMAWLDNKFRMGFGITEFEAAERLTEFRKETQKFMGLAYENISASGPNAAIPHYSPTRSTARMIDRTTPYLIDSGGQYLDGTCDTTRTLHFGHPTDEQCEAFTRVLKGHIALDQIVFPMGTTGAQLDVLARQALWRDGLNYLHGSGHGVGSFLSVHEGPHSFSNNVPLVPGHVMTNEPGYYKDGEWGLRIESALCVRKVETRGKFGGDIWLGFERFTSVPIQTKMIKSTLMSKEELQWVKNHNNDCLRRLERYIKDDERAMKWIRRELLKPIGAETRSAAGFMIEWH